MGREQRKERRRVSVDDVRNIAREAGGGKKYFNLPKDVDLWEPEKAGSYKIDFVPYLVTIDNHPDRRGDKTVTGDMWWRYPYSIHERIGPSQEAVICPASFGKACPICEEQMRLKGPGGVNYETNRTAIQVISAKRQVAYPILNTEDPSRFSVFSYSNFKFGDPLDVELDGVLKDAPGPFFDVTDEGKTVKVRFGDDEFQGRKFLKANRFDFEPRNPLVEQIDGKWDDGDFLEGVPCLDQIFIVHDYDYLKKLFFQLPDSAQKEPATKTSSAKPPSTPAKAPTSSKPPEKEAGTKFKVGQKVEFTDAKKKVQVGVITGIEDDEVTIKTADGKTHPDVDEEDVRPVTEKAPAVAATDAADAVVFKKGDRVIDDEKRIGTVAKVKEDQITVTLDDGGEKVTLDAEDLEFYNHDGKADGDDGDSEDEWVPAVGDEVAWDDEEGEIIKLHSTEPKAKVKSDAGVVAWIELSELKKAD